jgi:hypothetical protein
VTLPKSDQAAVWLSRDEIHKFDGIDDYNRRVLGQWTSGDEDGRGDRASSAMIASSRCT